MVLSWLQKQRDVYNKLVMEALLARTNMHMHANQQRQRQRESDRETETERQRETETETDTERYEKTIKRTSKMAQWVKRFDLQA